MAEELAKDISIDLTGEVNSKKDNPQKMEQIHVRSAFENGSQWEKYWK